MRAIYVPADGPGPLRRLPPLPSGRHHGLTPSEISELGIYPAGPPGVFIANPGIPRSWALNITASPKEVQGVLQQCKELQGHHCHLGMDELSDEQTDRRPGQKDTSAFCASPSLSPKCLPGHPKVYVPLKGHHPRFRRYSTANTTTCPKRPFT